MTLYRRAHAVAETIVGTAILWPLNEPVLKFVAKVILKALGY